MLSKKLLLSPKIYCACEAKNLQMYSFLPSEKLHHQSHLRLLPVAERKKQVVFFI